MRIQKEIPITQREKMRIHLFGEKGEMGQQTKQPLKPKATFFFFHHGSYAGPVGVNHFHFRHLSIISVFYSSTLLKPYLTVPFLNFCYPPSSSY
ncbi:hypothetical protein VNO77_09562 [Canavalia gladiata]|uniref:Uncharacterized protein n=1 Tax=Canavalia gladiata TaxID=3824 RepID=A0AAN9R1I3_CANGL